MQQTILSDALLLNHVEQIGFDPIVRLRWIFDRRTRRPWIGIALASTAVVFVCAREVSFQWSAEQLFLNFKPAFPVLLDRWHFAAFVFDALPLVIGAVVFTLMTTWKKGRDILAVKMRARSETIEKFLERIAADPPVRVTGKAVFLSGSPGIAPPSLRHNVKHNKVLHSEVAILSIATKEIPRVPREEKVEVSEIGAGFYSVTAQFGFMEAPNVPYVLALAREKGLDFELPDVSFFLGRERLLPGKEPGMRLWRSSIFAFMSQNAVNATAYFHIPPAQVVELGAQIEI